MHRDRSVNHGSNVVQGGPRARASRSAWVALQRPTFLIQKSRCSYESGHRYAGTHRGERSVISARSTRALRAKSPARERSQRDGPGSRTRRQTFPRREMKKYLKFGINPNGMFAGRSGASGDRAPRRPQEASRPGRSRRRRSRQRTTRTFRRRSVSSGIRA